MTRKKLPGFMLYPDDLTADEALAVVSIGAFGLWIKLLCVMHKCTMRGYLRQENGEPYSIEQIGRLTGCSVDEADHLLNELIDAGAASKTKNGIIYNRRMVREEEKRMKCSDAGKRGGGNPRLKGESFAPTFKGHPKGVPKGSCKGESGYGSGYGPEGEGGVGEGVANALPVGSNGGGVPTADVLRLAALAHAAFTATPPDYPSTLVCSNVRQLLEAGRPVREIEKLFAWRRATRLTHVPQSPQALSDPERFDQWWTMMMGDKPKTRGIEKPQTKPVKIKNQDDLPDEVRSVVANKIKLWRQEQEKVLQ